MCKNHILISLFIIISIYFVVTQTITCDNTFENMTDADQKNYPDRFEYGDVELNFNSNPADKNFYRVNMSRGKLDVANPSVLSNKKLYIYEPGSISPIIEDSYSEIIIRRPAKSAEDSFQAKYNTEREEYFH
jgi:hypothetical protein